MRPEAVCKSQIVWRFSLLNKWVVQPRCVVFGDWKNTECCRSFLSLRALCREGKLVFLVMIERCAIEARGAFWWNGVSAGFSCGSDEEVCFGYDFLIVAGLDIYFKMPTFDRAKPFVCMK